MSADKERQRMADLQLRSRARKFWEKAAPNDDAIRILIEEGRRVHGDGAFSRSSVLKKRYVDE